MSYTEVAYRVYELKNGDTFAEVAFNRPQSANAMSPMMLRELMKVLDEVKKAKHRVLILTGQGRNFCAGADLRWMRESGKVGRAQNIAEARLLANFFTHLHTLPIPVVAVVKGAVYGGAVGVVACCDYAIAAADAKFCLSEVRIGLVPAVILPYLARKLPRTFLLRAGLTGEVFDGACALANGLVSQIVPADELKHAVPQELNSLLKCAPQAQCQFKKMLAEFASNDLTEEMVAAIAEARSSKEAQEGIAAFFAKRPPTWETAFTDDWA